MRFSCVHFRPLRLYVLPVPSSMSLTSATSLVPSRSALSGRSIFRIAQHCSLCVEACLKGCKQAAAFIGEAKDLEGGLKAQDSFCHGTNIFIFWNWHMAVGDAELWALFRPMLLLQSTEIAGTT